MPLGAQDARPHTTPQAGQEGNPQRLRGSELSSQGTSRPEPGALHVGALEAPLLKLCRQRAASSGASEGSLQSWTGRNRPHVSPLQTPCVRFQSPHQVRFPQTNMTQGSAVNSQDKLNVGERLGVS